MREWKVIWIEVNVVFNFLSCPLPTSFFSVAEDKLDAREREKGFLITTPRMIDSNASNDLYIEKESIFDVI